MSECVTLNKGAFATVVTKEIDWHANHRDMVTAEFAAGFEAGLRQALILYEQVEDAIADELSD